MIKEQNTEENDKALHIGGVSESISVTKEELKTFLEDWDEGLQHYWAADWQEKSRKIAEFLGLIDD